MKRGLYDRPVTAEPVVRVGEMAAMAGGHAPALARALRRLVQRTVFVDNGLCSICRGYWPKEHLEGCAAREAMTALARWTRRKR